MGRRRAEKIRISSELVRRTADGVVLTEEVLQAYVSQICAQGRREDCIRDNWKTLRQFFDALAADKRIGRDTLAHWRDELLHDGYAIRTVNRKVSLINSLLESMDCREFQLSGQLEPQQYCAPELTRQEYIRMLQTARGQDDRRGYLLTKLFATTGVAVLELPKVTVEAVQSGSMRVRAGGSTRLLYFPQSLQEELFQYAKEKGCGGGAIFTKRNGEPLERTQVSQYIQRLAIDAHVPVEKGNIRSLRQLYKNTISGIEANFDLLVWQAYARQLEHEQLSVGWEENL